METDPPISLWVYECFKNRQNILKRRWIVRIFCLALEASNTFKRERHHGWDELFETNIGNNKCQISFPLKLTRYVQHELRQQAKLTTYYHTTISLLGTIDFGTGLWCKPMLARTSLAEISVAGNAAAAVAFFLAVLTWCCKRFSVKPFNCKKFLEKYFIANGDCSI